VKDPRAIDLATELAAARAEQVSCRARGDTDTAVLLAAWIDVLLDEWNRRQDWHAAAGPPGPPDRAV
jgi:hypothetical protein